MRGTRIAGALLLAGAIAAGAAWWLRRSGRENAPQFLTAPIRRGDLVSTITATGTIEPEAAVDVGAQVAGVIVAFGLDKHGKPVTWGSIVNAGDVLALIDDSLYAAAVKNAAAQVTQAEAGIQVAEANVQAAEANVLQQKANLLYATGNWDRAQKLGPSDALAQSAYDQYRDNYETAKASLAAAEAAVAQTRAAVSEARATVEQDKAALLTAQINLRYCTIRSPVKGVIVDRRVNIGQTVVSSLSAPSLFLIATDLSRIQAWVSVNEADVGNISVGEPVTFTVDALPGKLFHGRVGQVRLNATMTQNVVTYTIEVDIDNADGRLLPYLTSNAQFEIGRTKGALLAPNAALRWSPPPDRIGPDVRRKQRAQAPPQAGLPTGRAPEQAGARATLWVQDGSFVRPLSVIAGLTDGASTEVRGEGIKEGLRVVIGEAVRGESAPGEERNPFAPQVFRGQRPAQGQEQPAAPGQPPGPSRGGEGQR